MNTDFRSILETLTLLEGKPYQEMTPAERTADRIAKNRAIDTAIAQNPPVKKLPKVKIDKKTRDYYKIKKPEPVVPCIGCGTDWKYNWSRQDLARVKYKPHNEMVWLCPHCHEEYTNMGEIGDFKFGYGK